MHCAANLSSTLLLGAECGVGVNSASLFPFPARLGKLMQLDRREKEGSNQQDCVLCVSGQPNAVQVRFWPSFLQRRNVACSIIWFENNLVGVPVNIGPISKEGWRSIMQRSWYVFLQQNIKYFSFSQVYARDHLRECKLKLSAVVSVVVSVDCLFPGNFPWGHKTCPPQIRRSSEGT